MSDTDWKREHDKKEKQLIAAEKKLRFLSRVLTSWGLTKKISAYKKAASKDNPFPEPETENLAASFINRTLLGTLLGIFISLATLFILGSQTFIFFRQAELLGIQHNQAAKQFLINQHRELVEKLSSVKCTDDLDTSRRIKVASPSDGGNLYALLLFYWGQAAARTIYLDGTYRLKGDLTPYESKETRKKRTIEISESLATGIEDELIRKKFLAIVEDRLQDIDNQPAKGVKAEMNDSLCFSFQAASPEGVWEQFAKKISVGLVVYPRHNCELSADRAADYVNQLVATQLQLRKVNEDIVSFELSFDSLSNYGKSHFLVLESKIRSMSDWEEHQAELEQQYLNGDCPIF